MIFSFVLSRKSFLPTFYLRTVAANIPIHLTSQSSQLLLLADLLFLSWPGDIWGSFTKWASVLKIRDKGSIHSFDRATSCPRKQHRLSRKQGSVFQRHWFSCLKQDLHLLNANKCTKAIYRGFNRLHQILYNIQQRNLGTSLLKMKQNFKVT